MSFEDILIKLDDEECSNGYESSIDQKIQQNTGLNYVSSFFLSLFFHVFIALYLCKATYESKKEKFCFCRNSLSLFRLLCVRVIVTENILMRMRGRLKRISSLNLVLNFTCRIDVRLEI